MKKINLFILIASLSFALPSFAQKKNVAKLGLLGLGAKNIRLSYERVLTERFTAQLSFATLLRRDLPSQFTDAAGNEDQSGNASANASKLDYATFGGWNLMPEFRIYSKKKDGAPAGFYFGPYFKYNNYSIKLGGIDDGISYDAVGRFSSVGGGITLGCHWIIKDIITIDWNFLSLGANMGHITIDYESSQSGVDYNQWANDFNENSEPIKGFGELKAEAKSNGLKVTTPSSFGIGIRSGLSIGFYF